MCDDYQGKYANKDMFYKDREEYKDNKMLYKSIKLQQEGVGSAINYYVKNENTELTIATFGSLEPCFLYDKKNIAIKTKKLANTMRNSIIDFSFKEK